MKTPILKNLTPPLTSAQPAKLTKSKLQKRYDDIFSVKVKIDRREPGKRPDFSFQMLDYVKIKRDIQGTELKKGMHGSIVTLGGDPPTLVEVEISNPPFIECIGVDDIELVKRA